MITLAFVALTVPAASAHTCSSDSARQDCGTCPPPAAHNHNDTDIYDDNGDTGCSADACSITDIFCWSNGIRALVQSSIEST